MQTVYPLGHCTVLGPGPRAGALQAGRAQHTHHQTHLLSREHHQGDVGVVL